MMSGKTVLQAETVCAKALRQECAWCAGGTARRVWLSLEWCVRWGDQVRELAGVGSCRLHRTLWATVRALPFILREVGSHGRVLSSRAA